MKKIVIAHPLQQHSYKTAEALDNEGMLEKYITTVYYNENKRIYKILEKILKKDNIKRMHGRKNKSVEKHLKTYNELLGLLYLFITKIDSHKIIEPKLYTFLTNKFGKNVYKYIKNNDVDCVIMYDITAYKCFSLLKRNKSKCVKILDMSNTPAPTIRKIILNEINKKDIKYKKSLRKRLKSYSKKKCEKYQKELDYADYFLALSKDVKKILISNGIKEDRILYVPLGVDTLTFECKEYIQKKDNETLQFLFVGRVEATKGIYYLIQAFKELRDLNIELTIVGGINSKDDELLNDINNSDNITYCGLKQKSEMNEVFKKSDVYIMPSLFEGFSLSLIEAMSSGVPVITTKNSMADDVIENGKEGFVIDSASTEQIKEKILWFYNNRDKIPEMGKNARRLAEQYTWENYKTKLREAIKKI